MSMYVQIHTCTSEYLYALGCAQRNEVRLVKRRNFSFPPIYPVFFLEGSMYIHTIHTLQYIYMANMYLYIYILFTDGVHAGSSSFLGNIFFLLFSVVYLQGSF